MVEPCRQATRPQRGIPCSLQVELPRNVAAPGLARAAVGGLCNDFDFSPSHSQTLMLLVSEVVSNAVLHSQGPLDALILLNVVVGEDMVRIAVTDAGEGFTPTQREPERVGGRYGLYLLDKAASRWGVDQVGGTRVWFELPRT